MRTLFQESGLNRSGTDELSVVIMMSRLKRAQAVVTFALEHLGVDVALQHETGDFVFGVVAVRGDA